MVDRASAVGVVSDRPFVDVLGPLVQPGYRLACAMLHDPAAAEDVVQEASLIAWKKISRVGDRGTIRAWFLGIVANECRNARRRRWRTKVSSGLPDVRGATSPEDRVVARADLRRALLELPDQDRLIVALFFYLDLPLDEVASVVGISASAARSRLYRAIHRLRPGLDVEEAIR